MIYRDDALFSLPPSFSRRVATRRRAREIHPRIGDSRTPVTGGNIRSVHRARNSRRISRLSRARAPRPTRIFRDLLLSPESKKGKETASIVELTID